MWGQILYAVCAPVLSSVAYRARGHRLGPEGSFWAKNLVNRTVWASFNTVMLAIMLGPSWCLVAVFVGGWIAAIMGHRSYIAAGVKRAEPIDGERHEPHALIFSVLPWEGWSDTAVDLVGLAWTGFWRGLLVTACYGWPVMAVVVAGHMFGHVAGYYISGRLPGTNDVNWIKRGEWWAGALIGLGYSALTLV
jgi:hypothetical protein